MHCLARLLDSPGGRENIIKKRGGGHNFFDPGSHRHDLNCLVRLAAGQRLYPSGTARAKPQVPRRVRACTLQRADAMAKGGCGHLPQAGQAVSARNRLASWRGAQVAGQSYSRLKPAVKSRYALDHHPAHNEKQPMTLACQGCLKQGF